MIQKRNPSVISQNNPLVTRPLISLQQSTFYLNFGIYDQKGENFDIDPSIFYVEVNQLRFSNRTKSYENFPLSYDKCHDQINYCILNDTNLEGFFDENQTSMISIKVFICKNNNCKSIDEIIRFFEGKILATMYLNNNFDFNNYSNPIVSTMYTEILYLDAFLSKTLNIFLKKAVFIDDDSFYFDSKTIQEIYLRDLIERDFTQNNLSSNLQNVSVGTVFFFSSKNLLQNTRVYQKIDQALANLTGLANFLIIICFFFVKYEQNLEFIKYVIL